MNRPTPDLVFCPEFLPSKSYDKLVRESIALRGKIDRVRTSILNSQSQSKSFGKECHYRSVEVQDHFRKLHGKFFVSDEYPHHALTCFRDNHNIPFFVASELIPAISKIPLVAEMMSGGFLNWSFTFKITPDHSKEVRFHEDVAFKDSAMMIYSLGAQSFFLLKDSKNPPDREPLELHPNSLLLLSGTVLSDYEHRIVPFKVAGPYLGLATAIGHISLILGCKSIPIDGVTK